MQLYLVAYPIILLHHFRTVFDINIEAFQQKPWRKHGVDLNDYFNFGLDEEGWRKYCFSTVGFMTLFGKKCICWDLVSLEIIIDQLFFL
jgi:hypothetical protein